MTALSDTDYPFALCLTHDVDRPFKTPVHAAFYALADRDPRHLLDLRPGRNPYWQFEAIMALEADLGVRSAFYFLNEPPVRARPRSALTDPQALVQAVGRYDVRDPPIARIVRQLDDGGWEVGLHGSYHTARDRERLAEEKARIESVLGHEIEGGRQHYLRFDDPETWRHYRDLGLAYDTSLGSTEAYGFLHGYGVRRPFDDGFVVFPLTLMEQTLPDPGERFDAAWAACDSLLDEARANDAVMTALFHPRLFDPGEFPGYRRLYRRLIERARDMGAWVGPPGEFYAAFLSAGESSTATAVGSSAPADHA
ncbi:polysaccharide deacetylase family protein (plasmid) [Halorientalis pallida]|uniref:polysaccharide deacetylase family protein n=1 Tax=Halorientalis pallida TaxID=2479928 RepID=UPI003C7033EF